MRAIQGYFNDQKIILTKPFFAAYSKHNYRDFHSHKCIEFSYVVSGSADHTIVFPDGKIERQKVVRGNYILMDGKAMHGYRNGSADFEVINLLFKLPFLFPKLNCNKGFVPSEAFSVTRSQWHENREANDIELRFFLTTPQKLCGKKYLRMWLDLSGNSEKIDFSNACAGLIANGDISNPFKINGAGKPSVYFLSEGESEWKPLKCGKDDCFGRGLFYAI